MFINFKHIPGSTKLFLDYIDNFEKLHRFYKYNYRNKEHVIDKFQKTVSTPNKFNDDLSSIISEQYSSLNPSAKTKKNISLLKKKETLAVITGQQLSLLGGPLYTFYKIITAIKLANYLSERYDNYNFVPVFWLEGDDHDFDEVRSVNILNENNELVKISYNDDIIDEDINRGSVGQIKFKAGINNFFNQLEHQLKTSEFKAKIIEHLKNYYQEGKNFKDSFRELLLSFFEPYGLLIFDPQDKKVKELLKPIFNKEIAEFRNHTQSLVNISAALEERYHAQVKIRPINLFYNYDEGRYLIEPFENEFRLKGKRKKFTFEEIKGLIETEPEKFSPNVLLRPICQDYLFPTAFYVGGPSEIAYFAQVLPLYEFYNIDPAIIYPRSSATILEKTIKSILDKYELEITSLFADPDKLKNQILSSISNQSLEEIFKAPKVKIDVVFDELKEKLLGIDKTMNDVVSKYRTKLLAYLDELYSKALEAQKKRHETALRQIDKAAINVFPNMNLQERELSFYHFANKYDLEFFKKIFDELTINKFEHQIIEIE